MSRRDLEKSRDKGKPRYFYHFFRGTEDWYYTDFRIPQSYNGDAYLPLEIIHGEIERGSDDNPGAVEVTLPKDSAVGVVLQEGSAPTPISLRISMMQALDAADPAIIFNGELRGADITEATCVVQAVPLQSRINVIMPRGRWQRKQCVWNTYDPDTCGVSKTGFSFNGTVSAIDGLTITVTGAAAFNAATDFFALGVMSFGEYKGMIEKQDGDNLLLQHAIPGLIVGSSVNLLAGDDRTKETCLIKFNNISRHMGFSQIPTTNPHYGQGLR